ncbi:MAG: aspartate/glutamate racemase family protein, partial [Pseudomonadota bacterium]
MRLLIVNPNTTEAMTERMAGVARAAAAPGTEIIALTAPRGFPYISSRAEAQVAGVVALEMIAAAPPADAAVIAAFGDPGLRAARELFAMPVVGLAEAAMLAACALGDRFAIVTFTPSMIDWYGEGVGAAGLGGRFAGFRVPPAARGPVADVAETMRADIETLVHDAAAD